MVEFAGIYVQFDPGGPLPWVAAGVAEAFRVVGAVDVEHYLRVRRGFGAVVQQFYAEKVVFAFGVFVRVGYARRQARAVPDAGWVGFGGFKRDFAED